MEIMIINRLVGIFSPLVKYINFIQNANADHTDVLPIKIIFFWKKIILGRKVSYQEDCCLQESNDE